MPVIELKPDGKESKRRFDIRDWTYIAEFVIEEYERRSREREDRERCWDEIDRQVAMEPQIEFKKGPDGRIDTKKRWMAETELPLQAQALEVHTADIRRMLFPVLGSWFRAHAEVTDEYLRKVDFQALIPGDENEVPSRMNQDNVDKLVQGFLLYLYRQPFNDEDFFTRMDRINAEAIKYGVGVGRARTYSKNYYSKMANGVSKSTRRMPVLAPCSIRNLYLDDPKPTTHSLQALEPAHIARDNIKLENLQMAANRGSTDPEDEDGGWMPQNLSKIIGDGDGNVMLLEMEGDIVVPRKTVRSMVIPGAIVTVVVGSKDKSGNVGTNVVRFRYRKSPFPSYLLFPYHFEGVDCAYPTSPLMKGRPVQMAATDALNRFLDSAMLKIAPPIGYDRTDLLFAQEGGPRVFPYAQWGTTDLVKVYTELGGDPAVMVGAMSQLINLFAELTGVLPARLGAQTVSHTTAYAKNAELERGATRTVDYVNQIGQGALTRWLHMSYYMALEELKPKEELRFWIDAYGGFVQLTKDQLPPRCGFEWFGAGGPGEEQARRQAKLQSLGLALQMDTMAIQTGRPPSVDISGAVREVLREGGWTDLDAIVAQAPAAPMPTPDQQDPGLALQALQMLPKAIAGAGG